MYESLNNDTDCKQIEPESQRANALRYSSTCMCRTKTIRAHESEWLVQNAPEKQCDWADEDIGCTQEESASEIPVNE